MIRGRTFTLAVLVATAASLPVRAQEAGVTIEQAVSEALDHNLNLLAERFNVQRRGRGDAHGVAQAESGA